ncbi:hypothetical protein GA417_05540 [Poseidonibacter ostreae]|uniref:hypothetical protein n=1 Tax=Poseidonibacter ostreae TaxID=2654171 RepID=UPI001265A032|nr:hypothetical protein [Poseidonibacter ostreae]KAB7886413.1 hypothetical protein GA417_05540 [Poseidonibacter ostreae]
MKNLEALTQLQELSTNEEKKYQNMITEMHKEYLIQILKDSRNIHKKNMTTLQEGLLSTNAQVIEDLKENMLNLEENMTKNLKKKQNINLILTSVITVIMTILTLIIVVN